MIPTGTAGGVTNPQSGRCLDAYGAATANGTLVQLYQCNTSGAQKWARR
ncbi:RICIN domain-containing protein [Dactylosporangium matsuzakiense]|uniref:Ricin B lectin domain-containing protein n=1 Tax=Dactylosporangium matsuzakiense TaxID=53360 RepID=A0A9W6KNY4_9ACTN|nr:RICIN domain-containing protein [Dactylosporangium matsuzakiense]UWZ42715.1 RICIN domain-containing protein [Dactylosporangium matsuzakiense]GLL03801.1 hypothetical protein GCM10017581_055470 [Dactylosporangium matsuzakiense]